MADLVQCARLAIEAKRSRMTLASRSDSVARADRRSSWNRTFRGHHVTGGHSLGAQVLNEVTERSVALLADGLIQREGFRAYC